MVRIEATRPMTATPDAIWDTVSDTTTWNSWFSIHKRWLKPPPARLTPDARLVAQISLLGMTNKLEWTVHSLSAPDQLILDGTGMAQLNVRLHFTVTPNEPGSTLTVTGDINGRLLTGAFGKAIERNLIEQLDTTARQLDALAAT